MNERLMKAYLMGGGVGLAALGTFGAIAGGQEFFASERAYQSATTESGQAIKNGNIEGAVTAIDRRVTATRALNKAQWRLAGSSGLVLSGASLLVFSSGRRNSS